jgi:hypothetical protein
LSRASLRVHRGGNEGGVVTTVPRAIGRARSSREVREGEGQFDVEATGPRARATPNQGRPRGVSEKPGPPGRVGLPCWRPHRQVRSKRSSTGPAPTAPASTTRGEGVGGQVAGAVDAEAEPRQRSRSASSSRSTRAGAVSGSTGRAHQTSHVPSTAASSHAPARAGQRVAAPPSRGRGTAAPGRGRLRRLACAAGAPATPGGSPRATHGVDPAALRRAGSHRGAGPGGSPVCVALRAAATGRPVRRRRVGSGRVVGSGPLVGTGDRRVRGRREGRGEGGMGAHGCTSCNEDRGGRHGARAVGPVRGLVGAGATVRACRDGVDAGRAGVAGPRAARAASVTGAWEEGRPATGEARPVYGGPGSRPGGEHDRDRVSGKKSVGRSVRFPWTAPTGGVQPPTTQLQEEP